MRYDVETGYYYLQSRYYDPEVGRFISADTPDILSVRADLYHKNLFAYCDNNPVVRVDHGGQLWDTIFDVVSLGASIAEVCMNPYDPFAWIGLAGDTIDLIPFVTGVGEVTRATKITINAVDETDDVIKVAKNIHKTADKTSDLKTATGSYEIIYKSGRNYVGKGEYNRAINSAIRNCKPNKLNGYLGDAVLSIYWKSSPNATQAFIEEFLMQKRWGGVLSSNSNILTYNKIWSPGRKYLR